jgi:haloalkane dehalogenase
VNLGTARLSKQSQVVGGKRLAYHERGDGDAIVFLHGNPTSSYLWRNVIPHLEHQGRCIAPDLLGMGDSDKLDGSGPDSYTFVEHRLYLDELLDVLDLGDRITFVVHDWGSALAFDWVHRHRDGVTGIAYMEAIVAPVNLDDWGSTAASFFRSLRSDDGEELILEKNLFVEAALPAGIMRELSDEEMAEYRRPFADPGEARRPTLSWPRQLPIDDEPAEVVEIVECYGKWMARAEIPKLFINGEPGWILTGRARDYCRTWPAQTEVTVPGKHYLQEDSAELIGAAISEWLTSTRQ